MQNRLSNYGVRPFRDPYFDDSVMDDATAERRHSAQELENTAMLMQRSLTKAVPDRNLLGDFRDFLSDLRQQGFRAEANELMAALSGAVEARQRALDTLQSIYEKTQDAVADIEMGRR